MTKVVVLGAGSAGLAAGRRLSGGGCDVVVVDENNVHSFKALLYQVATAGLGPGDVAYPVRTIFGRSSDIGFRRGSVRGIDVSARVVTLANGTELSYDYLIVATGSVASFFGLPGAEEYSLPLYTLADARRLRNKLLASIEAADRGLGDGGLDGGGG